MLTCQLLANTGSSAVGGQPPATAFVKMKLAQISVRLPVWLNVRLSASERKFELKPVMPSSGWTQFASIVQAFGSEPRWALVNASGFCTGSMRPDSIASRAVRKISGF